MPANKRPCIAVASLIAGLAVSGLVHAQPAGLNR